MFSAVNQPRGISFNVVTSEKIHIQLPVPENWTTDMVFGEPAFFTAMDPSERSELFVFLFPPDVDTTEMENYFTKLWPEQCPAQLPEGQTEPEISGYPTECLYLNKIKRETTIYFVEHTHGGYAFIKSVTQDTTPKEREILTYMLSQLRIIE